MRCHLGVVKGAYPITKGYFSDDTIVWPRREEEVWKHRVEIDPAPVFEGHDVPPTRRLA